MYKILLMDLKLGKQTKSEIEKNYQRVVSILNKSELDIDKAMSLSKAQANRITNENKSLNRAIAARELSNEFLRNGLKEKSDVCLVIFEEFLKRACDLGLVDKKDYRDYQLEKLGL